MLRTLKVWVAAGSMAAGASSALAACPPTWRALVDTGPVPTTTVMDMAVMLPNGNALIGGARYADESGAPRLVIEVDAATHTTTLRNPTVPTSPNGPATVLHDGRVLIGSRSFTGLALYDPTTHAWSPAVSPNANLNLCQTLLCLSDGRVVGSFNQSSGGSGSLDVLDVQTWTWTNIWRAPASSADQQATSLAQLPDGDIVAGGTYNFAPAGGAGVGIARYRRSTNTWSQLGTTTAGVRPVGYPNGVWTMKALPGGDVLVGGVFTSIDGVPANGLARFRFASNTWTGMLNGNGAAGMATQADGTVLVVGDFMLGTPAQRSLVARYDPAANAWTRVDGVPTAMGFAAIAAMSNGEFVYAGWPHNAGSGMRSMVHVGRRPDCRADVNCSGGLEPQDIFDYLANWFASEPAADINGSGGVTQQDIVDYVGLWMAGCD